MFLIFVARLLQEKCREQNRHLYIAFIDLAKAFDTINRSILWTILTKFGCPPIFLDVLRDFHDGMTARVSYCSSVSDFFPVRVGVRQGCVLAPVIFNFFMAAVTLHARPSFALEDGIALRYRLDGSLFNTRRLQARTKSSLEYIFELQYADDTALVSHTPSGLQNLLNGISTSYGRAGLVVNTRKTEILQIPCHPDDTRHVFHIDGAPLSNITKFTYLGSMLSGSHDLMDDIQRRVNLASAAFGRLSHRVFLNRDLTTKTKMMVYNAICISTLLYGSEAWITYRRQKAHKNSREVPHLLSYANFKTSLATESPPRRDSTSSWLLLYRDDSRHAPAPLDGTRHPDASKPPAPPRPLWRTCGWWALCRSSIQTL